MEWQHTLRGKMWAMLVVITALVSMTTASQPTTLSAKLVGGTTTRAYKSGRLTISGDGINWRDICSQYNAYRQSLTEIVCRQNGFRRAQSLNYGAYGSGEVMLNVRVDCPHTAYSLDECSVQERPPYKNCYPMSIICYNRTEDVLQLRLVDGSKSNGMINGRVEVTLADLGKGAVCTRGDSYLYHMACQFMGYKYGKPFSPTPPKNGSLSTTVKDYRCSSGSNDFLQDCEGYIYSANSSDGVCDYYWLGVQCSNTSVRLQTSIPNVFNAGSVDVMTTSMGYSEVCDEGWDDNDAKVVCKELGYSGGKALCCNQLGAHVSDSWETVSAYTTVSCTGNEDSLDKCPMTAVSSRKCLTENGSRKLASVICYETPKEFVDMQFATRLVRNGNVTTNQGWGTVQVKRLGFWGDVCPNNFTDKEASVVCRSLSLGYVGGRAYAGERWYTQATRPVWIQNVTCNGTEPSLDDCAVNGWGKPLKQVYDYQKRLSLPKCAVGSGVICYHKELELHLVREGSKTFGRLEISHDGSRGTICGDNFIDVDAKVACRTLNFTDGRVLKTDFPQGSGPVFISNTYCYSNYDTQLKSLFSCNSQWNNATSECMSHSNDAKVYCSNDVSLMLGDHRTGMVVTYRGNSDPYLVCNIGNFDDNAAAVLCRSLGFKKGLVLPAKVFGFHVLAIDRDFLGVQCAGNETNLADCPRAGNSLCTDPYNSYASVSCYDDELTTEKYTVDMQQEQGTQLAGRVRVFYKQTSGYACQSSESKVHWTDEAASVFCRQKGSKGGVAYSFEGIINGPYFITEAQNCSASVTSLDACASIGSTTCDSNRAAGVLCYNSVPPNMTLTSEGRISITVDGEEGRVCGHQWSTTEATAVCIMLGHFDGMPTRYPRSGKPIFMSRVNCKYEPSTIFQCNNYGWRRTLDSNCTGENATEAGVFCFDNVRILSGQRTVADNITGRVQMKYESYWYRPWKEVCADLGPASAKVICRELGFNTALEMKSTNYESYTTSFELHCKGDENSTAYCPFSLKFCRHSANVFCYNAKTDGEWKWNIRYGYHGEVQVVHQGMEGYICADGWDASAANTLCREKGHKGGIVFGASGTLQSFHQNYVWFSNVTCPADATSMTQCYWNKTVHLNCRSASAYPASVLCYNVSVPTVSIVNGLTHSYGRVQIDYDGVKGSICRGVLTRDDARVLCKELNPNYMDGEVIKPPANSTSDGPWYLSRLSCNDSHTSIFECPNFGWNLSHRDHTCMLNTGDAWVSCFASVKLFGGLANMGPVGFYNGVGYQLVCSEGFDDKAAKVVCAELGFQKGLALYPTAFGYQNRSTGPVVRCSGNIGQRFKDCLTTTSCRNTSNYASVVCSNQDDITAYKVSLQSKDHGKVIVDKFNQPGYICMDDFDDRDAQVVCRESFYLTGVAYAGMLESRNNLYWLSQLHCFGNESRLDSCRLDNTTSKGQFGKIKPSSFCKPAAVFCAMTATAQTMFEWRLKDNTTKPKPRTGLVQVKLNGTWGTVCNWGKEEVANVFCRQLSYSAGRIIRNTFGTELNAVWIKKILCTGNESKLQDCMMDIGTNATCYSTLAVECDQSVRLSTVNGKPSGEMLKAGRLEVADTSGRFFSVCASGFNNRTADLTCKELGHVAAFYQSFSVNSTIATSIMGSANITCPATASTFSDCQQNAGNAGVACPQGSYVVLFCLDVANPQEDLTITMQGRPAGQPRATRYGFEGSICGMNFGSENADVVCKQLGFAKGHKLKPTSGRVLDVLPYVLSGLACAGTESSGGGCSRKAFVTSNTDCLNNTTPSVLCATATDKIQFRLYPPNVTWARAEVKIDGMWMAIDRTGFYTPEASVFCKSAAEGFSAGSAARYSSVDLPPVPIAATNVHCEGHENSILECDGNWTSAAVRNKDSSSAIYVQCQRAVRLIEGSVRSGKPLYRKGYYEGAICGDKFDNRDAAVVCRELGFDNGYSTCCSPYGMNWRDYYYTDVECHGNETRLGQCQLSTDTESLDSCSARNYAAVACYYNSDSRDYNLTLEEGQTYSGAVFINYLGTQGLICNDMWDHKDASVACREMGFENGLAYTHYKALYYGYIPAPYWTSGFQCNGSENLLSECQHADMGSVTECTTRHAAGVLCYHDTAIAYRMVRSEKKNNTMAGRVEAYVNGVWSTLCASYWGDNDASVFCRSQGFVDGVSIDAPKDLPAATGPVLSGILYCNGSERELNDCVHKGWEETTSYFCEDHSNDAAALCFNVVRLDSWFGDVLTHGSFKVFTGDEWSLVCDDDFDDLTARYVCNDLGYADGRALCCSAYNGVFNTAEINHTVSLHCNGDEVSVDQCLSVRPCYSDYYASVVCETPNVKFNDTVFKITNSQEGSTGRLIVEHLGIKGRICANDWTDTDAHVFCKSIGFTSGLAYYHSHDYEFNDETDIGPFFLSKFACTGNEKNLLDCPHSDRLHLGNCSRSASVACYENSGVQYRLKGGKSHYGRVELSLDHRWGTVCNDGWSNVDADVFCRSMNFTSGIAKGPAEYGKGTGPIWLQDLQCDGTEAVIHACPHSGFTESSGGGFWFSFGRCTSHDDDATVFCFMNARVVSDTNDLEFGALELYHDNQWLAVCDSSFTNTAAAVACKSMNAGFVDGVVIKGSVFAALSAPLNISSVQCSGNEATIDQCTIQTGVCPSGHYASVHCSNKTINQTGYQVRLSSDIYSGDMFGIVEIYDNGVWKRICDQGWDDADANVACKELNFKGGVAYTHIAKHFGPMGFRQMNCTGRETSLRQCSNASTPDLDECHYDSFEAAVLCYRSSGVSYSLSGGNSSSMGRVDITHDGTTAGICSVYWSHNNSKVLCRSLGYQDGLPYEPDDPAPKYPYFFLNGFFCTGDEKTLLSCLNSGINSTYLGSSCYNEAYTKCLNKAVYISDTRLVLTNGSVGHDRGRVEVYVSGFDEWGTVCDDFWDDFDATVVCRYLNFVWGEALREAAFGEGTGRIMLDNVECIGNETSLAQCLHRGLSTNNCYHSEDAGVICYNTPRPTLPPTPPRPTSTTTSTSTSTSSPASTPVPVTNTTITRVAEEAKDNAVKIAVGVTVGILVLLIVVIIVVVLLVRRKSKPIPHQRFPEDNVALPNQMFDESNPEFKYMAGDGEVTLGNDRAVYVNNGYSDGRSSDNADAGFVNPMYSVMNTPSQNMTGSEESQAPVKQEAGAAVGSSA